MGLGRYYLAEARNGLVSEFQYRVAAAIALLGFLIEPVIYLAVWRTVALAQGGEVGGYDANDFTAYYIVWSLVRVMNLALTPYSWEWRIRGGRLNEFLIRPVHPFHRDFAFFAGQKPVWIAIWVPMAIILWLTYRPEVELTIARSLVFFVSIWAAFVIRHMYLFMLGALNFWTTRTSALFELSIAVELLLSGRLVPLSLMPDWVQRLSLFLPYRWTFLFPIETMIGRLSWSEIGVGIARPNWLGGRSGARHQARVGPRHQAVHGGGRMKAIRLIWAYFRVAAANDLQYRANFVLQLINSALSLTTGLIAISLVYAHTDQLGGWTEPELLVVMGVHILLGGVIGSLIEPNMRHLMEEVEEGTFDLVLTRPADAQLLVSIRNFRVWRLVDVVLGLVVIGNGAGRLGVTPWPSDRIRACRGSGDDRDVLRVARAHHLCVSGRESRLLHRPVRRHVSSRSLAGLDLSDLAARNIDLPDPAGSGGDGARRNPDFPARSRPRW